MLTVFSVVAAGAACAQPRATANAAIIPNFVRVSLTLTPSRWHAQTTDPAIGLEPRSR